MMNYYNAEQTLENKRNGPFLLFVFAYIEAKVPKFKYHLLLYQNLQLKIFHEKISRK